MKTKYLPCQLCGTEVQMRQTIKSGENKGKKACKFCKTKADPPKRYKTKIRKVTPKTAAKNKERSKIRAEYFDFHIKACTQSEESKKPILNPNRSNICHLFSKSQHPSVQADLGNYVYLTLDEHTKFDTHLFRNDFETLEKEFPNAWPTVCTRIKEILPQVKENTKFKRKISEYLGLTE